MRPRDNGELERHGQPLEREGGQVLRSGVERCALVGRGRGRRRARQGGASNTGRRGRGGREGSSGHGPGGLRGLRPWLGVARPLSVPGGAAGVAAGVLGAARD